MHAYPVGGSQKSWGTFIWVPLLTLGAAEAAGILRAATKTMVTAMAGLVAFGSACVTAVFPWERWRNGEPLRLPGAEMMRLPGSMAAVLRAVSDNVATHSDTLFSLPGLFSFNLWSGRPTPTGANVTVWFRLLSAAQQEEIIRRLDADSRAGLLVEQRLLAMATASGTPPSGPLYNYIHEHFTPAVTIGSHEIWMKRGRTIAPLRTAQLYKRAAGATGADWRLEVCVASSPGSSIASAEWVEYTTSRPGRLALKLTAANTRVEATPLFSTGTSAGPMVTGTLPCAAPLLARFAFVTDEPLGTLSQNAVIRLRDATGALIGEAVFAR
jgi:hypothetical protein